MNRSRLAGLAAIAILAPIAAAGWASAPAQPERGPERGAERGAERAQTEHVPVIASRFGRPVTANEARTLKTEEETALAVAEAAAHDMDVLAHTVPERRLARNELATLHAIRPLIQRRQQLRQTFIRLGAKPILTSVSTQSKTNGPRPAGARPGSRSAGLGGTAAAGGSAIGSAAGGEGQVALIAATHQMQETQMSFNLQYLQLQSAIQAPSLKTTVISDILKTKHDTVKNVIGNIR